MYCDVSVIKIISLNISLRDVLHNTFLQDKDVNIGGVTQKQNAVCHQSIKIAKGNQYTGFDV